jgi:L-fuconolactonase
VSWFGAIEIIGPIWHAIPSSDDGDRDQAAMRANQWRRNTMRVDAHQHFWQLSRGDYDWPTSDLKALYRDFAPDDLARQLAVLGIDRTVLVQVTQTLAETQFCLDLAARNEFVGAVVGWVDMLSPEAEETIARFARQPKFRGVRPMLQALSDPAWIVRSGLAPAVRALVKSDLSFDALVKPPHLRYLLEFCRRHPELRIVIDHGAKPLIADAILDPWRDQMAALAELPNVWCKLSGLLTEAGSSASASVLRPYVEHLIRLFTPHRLMWGSDWPVLLLADSYPNWLRMAEQLLGNLSQDERSAVFGETARRFYRIDE